jgi:putative spermidine/putrescine transport system permease protein
MMSENRLPVPAWLLYGLTAVIVAFLLVPMLVPVVMSVSDTPLVTFPPQGFTLKWYASALQERDFTESFAFSVLLGVLSAAGAIVIGTPAALGLVRYRFKGREAVQALILSPLIFPMLVTGIALLRLATSLGSQNALLNLTIGHVLVTTPYVVRSVSASLIGINPSLEEAAQTLGANRFVAFWRITRPQIMDGLVSGGLFAFVSSFDNYAVSMWLFDSEHTPLPLTMFSLISRMFDPGIAAISSLMTLFALVLIVVVERLSGLRRAMSV